MPHIPLPADPHRDDDRRRKRTDVVQSLQLLGAALACALAVFLLPRWLEPGLVPGWIPDTLATITAMTLAWRLVRWIRQRARTPD
jgi:hypothetical protein